MLLAEVLVLEGMDMGDVHTSTRDEGVELMDSIGVPSDEHPEGELGAWGWVVWEE